MSVQSGEFSPISKLMAKASEIESRLLLDGVQLAENQSAQRTFLEDLVWKFAYFPERIEALRQDGVELDIPNQQRMIIILEGINDIYPSAEVNDSAANYLAYILSELILNCHNQGATMVLVSVDRNRGQIVIEDDIQYEVSDLKIIIENLNSDVPTTTREFGNPNTKRIPVWQIPQRREELMSKGFPGRALARIKRRLKIIDGRLEYMTDTENRVIATITTNSEKLAKLIEAAEKGDPSRDYPM